MLVARYFMYVGGVLLALIFAIGELVPGETVVADNSAPERPTVRIHSDQKLPERVVYDTSLPTIVPPTANVQLAAAPQPPAPAVAAASAQARVRDTFAQFIPAEAKKPDSKVERPKKRKIARMHANPPWGWGPPMRVAQQQPRFGFFGAPSWNSTW
jgi:hypothetical protein